MKNLLPRPLPSSVALPRMISMIGVDMPYELGTGGYDSPLNDVPWTKNEKTGKTGADCAGVAMSWAYGIPRHRPGYNHGSWSSVSDDLNTNSGIEDAEHDQDLWTVVDGDDVRPGDILCYPTIMLRTPDGSDYLRNDDGSIKKWIGHVQMVESVPTGWKRAAGHWGLLHVIHCCGPNDRRPAVVRAIGIAMDHHDATWGGKPEHAVKVLRVRT